MTVTRDTVEIVLIAILLVWYLAGWFAWGRR